MNEPSVEHDRSELDVMVAEWEARRPLLVKTLQMIKERGLSKDVVVEGGFMMTFVLASSESMLMIQDENGQEALVRVPEVTLDEGPEILEFSDLIEGVLSVVRLKSAMRRVGVLSIVSRGGYSVSFCPNGELDVCFSGHQVRLDSKDRLIPNTTDFYEFIAAVEILHAAALAYRPRLA